MISIQVETVDSWYREAIPLIYNHWQELGLDTDLKGDINTGVLRKLEEVNSFSVITVREDKNLVGYLLGLHTPHLHYQSSPPMFIVDMYYLTPDHRQGNGARLFKFMESYAREIGCIKIYVSCKIHQDHSELFKALGYRLSDYAFTKRI